MGFLTVSPRMAFPPLPQILYSCWSPHQNFFLTSPSFTTAGMVQVLIPDSWGLISFPCHQSSSHRQQEVVQVTIRTKGQTQKAAQSCRKPLHAVPRPAFPTSEPASTQLLSESGQEAIVAEVLEAAGAATCREKLQQPCSLQDRQDAGSRPGWVPSLRTGQQLPELAWFQSSDPNTSTLHDSICLANQNLWTATEKPASARDKQGLRKPN